MHPCTNSQRLLDTPLSVEQHLKMSADFDPVEFITGLQQNQELCSAFSKNAKSGGQLTQLHTYAELMQTERTTA